MPSGTFIAPIPNCIGPAAIAGPQSSVNIDGFSDWPGLKVGGVQVLFEASGLTYTLAYEMKLTMILEGPTPGAVFNGNAGYFSRGYEYNIGSEDDPFTWIIFDSEIANVGGGKSKVTIHWQSLGGYLPPDEWSIERDDLKPRIERAPFYAALNPADYAIVLQAVQSATISGRATGLNQLQSTSNPALAANLYDKYCSGIEVYYLSAARYIWSTYYLPGDMPPLSPGGVRQTPGGPAGYMLPFNNIWLRHADTACQSQYGPLGGIQKLTRVWVGAPNFGNSIWDPDIYPAG